MCCFIHPVSWGLDGFGVLNPSVDDGPVQDAQGQKEDNLTDTVVEEADVPENNTFLEHHAKQVPIESVKLWLSVLPMDYNQF